MRRIQGVIALAGLAFAAACSDGASTPKDPFISVVCAANPNWVGLKAEADSVLTAGSANATRVQGQLDNLRQLCATANAGSAARQQAVDVADFVADQHERGALHPIVPAGSTAEQEAVDFINHVLAAAVVDLFYTHLTNTWIVNPGDTTQTLVTVDGTASITVSGADVDSTTLITAEQLPPSTSYLQTDLDQYARYYRFTRSSLGGDTAFNNPVTVAICVLTPRSLPDSIFRRLRIGAQHESGFEVTTHTNPPSSLDCAAAQARLRAKAIESGASASIIGDDGSGLEARGGVAGLADNFSDFGVVDPEITARGGVGGMADNFRPPVRGQVAAAPIGNCPAVQAVTGNPLPVNCRPMVTFKTVIGQTPLDGIPVTFTVTTGGGQIAAEDPTDRSCGAFGASVTVTSAVGTGEARVCWTLGVVGDNTLSAVAGPGGDAIEGTYFAYAAGGSSGSGAGAGIAFTAEALKADAGTQAVGGAFAYSGQPVTGSGSCSPSSLVPSMSYVPGGATPPVNAGSYTLTVTCGGGSTLWNATSSSAAITISAGTSQTSISCPAAIPYLGAPVTPCTATATGSGNFTASVPVTYINNGGVGTATAQATFAGDQNHSGSSASTTFFIQYATSTVTVTCSDGAYSGLPVETCSAVATGAGGLNVPVTSINYSNNVNAGLATATAVYNGDAYHSGNVGTATFTIDPAPTTVTLTCAAAVYTAAPITGKCTARATGAGGLNVAVPAISYSANRNVGYALAQATFAGDANHAPGTGTGTFFISAAPATATTGSATIDFGDPVPTIPCTMAGLLGTDSDNISCTSDVSYTVAGAFPVKSVLPIANNYQVTRVNGTLTVIPYAQTCPEPPLYASPPPAANARTKSQGVPIWCTLTNSHGARVATGHGDLEVRAAGAAPAPGTDPLSYPVVFSVTDAFQLLSSIEYSYRLDTTPATFVVGQYYYVTVRWNDGSTMAGWFLLK